ncbi:uncharacterized protein LOC108319228 isoform X3 [Vigna angularis]|uniref:uncharacterized protein LOC108319228 isoform X3 n=1 Tax=Phaseolus angularis TaxID=3914 RepID=UPI0022B4EAA3|nr:uncharacterized protein LOC108319228 isoform X3 [Vigna angularis]
MRASTTFPWTKVENLGECVSWVCIITHRHASRLVLALVIREFGESEEAVSEMAEMRGRDTWTEELASLIEDSGVRYGGDPNASSATSFEVRRSVYAPQSEWVESGESLKEQALGFVMAWCEILLELGRGFRDILRQNLMNEDSYVVRKFGGPCSKVSKRLRFLNDFLPEDRDPVHAWSIVFFVFILALAAISVDPSREAVAPMMKVRKHPPSASRVQLPDGRFMAYHEQGLPGVKSSLLEEYGIRFITYDLPGFGESDPHPNRNLNSSAIDVLHLVNAINVSDKFWLLCHSTGCIHAWAFLRYVPERIAGAAMLAPMVNPYDPHMTKEETKRTWEKWLPRRKMMYSLARRFPKLLPFFYRKSFLPEEHDEIDKLLSFSKGKKDKLVIEEPEFEQFWIRDVEESVRQGNIRPFIEEVVLQVSNWGFDLKELHVQKKCQAKGLLLWLKSMYSQVDCELAGFLGLTHIWQGLDDRVVPPSMTEYIERVLPEAAIYKLPNEAHFSYFYFCDQCHRQIFSTLFGTPQGPVQRQLETAFEEAKEEAVLPS